MQPVRATREWPALEPSLFAGALLAYVAGLPLGLERVRTADVVTEALTLSGQGQAGSSPLGLLVVRLCAWIPLGDLASRAQLASALCTATAVALVARLVTEALRPLRGSTGRPPGFDAVPRLLAGLAGAAVFALTLGTSRVATSAGGAASTLALVCAGLLGVLRLARAPGRVGTGGAVALIAGAAISAEAPAAWMLWPPSLLVTIWALRRGQRWPVLAPLLFVVGLTGALYLVAQPAHPATLDSLVARVWPTSGAPPFELEVAQVAWRELAEQVGVVALLLAAPGLFVLARRAPGVCALALWTFGMASLFAARAIAPGRPDDTGAAGALVLVGLALAIGAGVLHFAGKLGRAEAAAAAALALIAAAPPAFDGGRARWSPDIALAERLLDQGLDAVPLRGVLRPGTPEMESLFRYAATLGLRPDIAWPRPSYGKMPRSP
jgi:hypothetical protein